MAIDKEDIERLKEIFVTRKEHDAVTGDINNKLANDDKKLAVIDTKVTAILWLLAAIGTAVVAALVKKIFGA